MLRVAASCRDCVLEKLSRKVQRSGPLATMRPKCDTHDLACGSVKPQRTRTVPAAPPVEVRASKKRRSTVSASWEDGRIVVLVPSRLGTAERDAVVDELVQRLLRRAPMHHSDDSALVKRSNALADQYLDGVRATSIRWVGNQRKRWGSCSPGSGDIRISDRLRPVPSWVLDAVLVHELAHLIEPSHSRRFRGLTARYPQMKQADTFLHGFSVGLESGCERSSPYQPFDRDLVGAEPRIGGDYVEAQGRLFVAPDPQWS
jgi:hypothetical protein